MNPMTPEIALGSQMMQMLPYLVIACGGLLVMLVDDVFFFMLM